MARAGRRPRDAQLDKSGERADGGLPGGGARPRGDPFPTDGAVGPPQLRCSLPTGRALVPDPQQWAPGPAGALGDGRPWRARSGPARPQLVVRGRHGGRDRPRGHRGRLEARLCHEHGGIGLEDVAGPGGGDRKRPRRHRRVVQVRLSRLAKRWHGLLLRRHGRAEPRRRVRPGKPPATSLVSPFAHGPGRRRARLRRSRGAGLAAGRDSERRRALRDRLHHARDVPRDPGPPPRPRGSRRRATGTSSGISPRKRACSPTWAIPSTS